MRTLASAVAALLATVSLGASAVGRMVDISIVDRESGRELPVYWSEGQAYVVGNPGREYKILARNRRGEDLLAIVSVDGVNALSGETASFAQSGYVLPARARMEIKGWRRNWDETASFYFTSLSDSYAGRTFRPDDVGVIGVAVFQGRADSVEGPDWRGEPKRSSPEPQMKRHGGAPPPLGTGHGRSEWSQAAPVEFERDSDEPVETITVRYDSYRNLVAQGVIPTRYGRRSPDPFPYAFAPDPPRYRR